MRITRKSFIPKLIFNVLLGIDCTFNAIAGGDPRETISSRVGKIKRSHRGRIPWHHPIAHLVDCVCETIDPGHAIDSINNSHGKNAVIKP